MGEEKSLSSSICDLQHFASLLLLRRVGDTCVKATISSGSQLPDWIRDTANDSVSSYFSDSAFPSTSSFASYSSSFSSFFSFLSFNSSFYSFSFFPSSFFRRSSSLPPYFPIISPTQYSPMEGSHIEKIARVFKHQLHWEKRQLKGSIRRPETHA